MSAAQALHRLRAFAPHEAVWAWSVGGAGWVLGRLGATGVVSGEFFNEETSIGAVVLWSDGSVSRSAWVPVAWLRHADLGEPWGPPS
jgi:hypothetical protein